jgi:hydrogenase expression/formation protein HypD
VKYVSSFRNRRAIEQLVERLSRACSREWKIMEVCGGQTHAIVRYGLDNLLPDPIELVHGPGCPVCVTPLERIAAAHELARSQGVVLCSFGDMMRVPGPDGDLLAARAAGADVRIVLSPLDALSIAQETPDREVVFFAVGFETTAPSTAMAIEHARTLGVKNFSVLAAHVRVPPAIDLILSAPDNLIQGFLAAGHVCTVQGTAEYPELVARHKVPIAVTGFEPADILPGLCDVVEQLETGKAELTNRYERAVREEGNALARAMVEKVFEIADRPWRGLGVIARGGLAIAPAYRELDAEQRFTLRAAPVAESRACRAADVLKGRLLPTACPAFGRECTPDSPLGAPMVSTEGACAAYYRYRKHA